MASATRSAVPRPALLHDVDWPTYLRLIRVFELSRRFRLTYDRGTLEIMSPLYEHEGPAYLLGRFIDVITEVLDIPCRAGRSMTPGFRCYQTGAGAVSCRDAGTSGP